MSLCARVLAAALMAVVIAAVIGLPARWVAGNQRDRAIVAPPSSQLRALHVRALPPLRRQTALVVTHARAARVVRAVSHPRIELPSPPQVAQAPTPVVQVPSHVAPVPPRAPVERALAEAPPATVSKPAAATPAPAPASTKHGNGKAKGHDKPHGNPHDSVTRAPAPAPPLAPSTQQQAPEQPSEGTASQGHGHAYGHDK